MVDRITKRLNKLSRKDRDAAELVLARVKRGELKALHVKKLRGSDNLFRVRKGRVRVIFAVQGKNYEIIDVDLRSDTTYKKY